MKEMAGNKRIPGPGWVGYGALAVILLLLGVLGYVAWTQLRQQRDAAAAAKIPPPPVDPLTQSYTGKLKALSTVLVPAPLDGTLESLEVEDMEDVAEGQLLGRILNTTLETAKTKATEDLERAKSKQEEAESQLIAARLEASRASSDAARVKLEYDGAAREFQRQQTLFQAGAGARKNFDKAEAAFRQLAVDYRNLESAAKQADARVSALQNNVAQARQAVTAQSEEMEGAEAELLTGEVKAPASGLLIGHRKNAGEEVTRDIEDLFEIATDLASMQVIVDIPEALAKQLSPGGNALVQIAEAGPAPLAGVIKDVQDGQAFVDFQSPNPAIRPGMTAQVRFLPAPTAQKPL
jgi:multidrug resistance efflux pump